MYFSFRMPKSKELVSSSSSGSDSDSEVDKKVTVNASHFCDNLIQQYCPHPVLKDSKAYQNGKMTAWMGVSESTDGSWTS